MSTAEETHVVFRVFKDVKRCGSEPLALFPYLEHSKGYCMSYSRIGQHSAASYDGCIKASRAAKPSEYYQLKRELERIGYVLKVRVRR